MKSSKAQIQAKYHKMPVIRFENQKLTSFSGLLIFQLLFKHINLKNIVSDFLKWHVVKHDGFEEN